MRGVANWQQNAGVSCEKFSRTSQVALRIAILYITMQNGHREPQSIYYTINSNTTHKRSDTILIYITVSSYTRKVMYCQKDIRIIVKHLSDSNDQRLKFPIILVPTLTLLQIRQRITIRDLQSLERNYLLESQRDYEYRMNN